MFEPHKFTPQPSDAQAPSSALRQVLPYISFDPLGDVATIAAVEEGDGCEASATLLDAFLDSRKSIDAFQAPAAAERPSYDPRAASE